MMMDGASGNADDKGDADLREFRPDRLNRRSFLIGSAASVGVLGLAGCMSSDARLRREAAAMYGPVPDDKFPIPATDISKVKPKYFRQTVRYETDEAPGTIIIDPSNYHVYRVEGGGKATRYGANVGRQGFLWSGNAYVGRKAEWPTWTPPKEMIEREPRAAKYAGGMPGGPDNPLGARTLYLYQDGVYTLYTIYASRYPETIGTNLTSGCTGLMTQDMIHLYDQTPVDTKVIVLPV
ncbi:L,D-transpeptidase [Chthonobacter albigriseus]|uniref:L,D-transpeptidase n=1 Tax=Chthonobacter albigriseus TaxID=1683161 RepID=UPI0015EF62AA